MSTRSRACATVATFHPRELIKRPSNKSLAWKDLLLLMEDEFLKSGLLAFGSLDLGRAGVRAAAPDPLAPFGCDPAASRSSLRRQTAVRSPATPQVSRSRRSSRSAAPPQTVAVPKDWRGVFDAIDAGNWASAQAGIAALPPSILTSVAKAELYTAKGSPVGRPRLAPGAASPRRPSFRRPTSSPLWRSGAARPSRRSIVPEQPIWTSARRRSATEPVRSRASLMPISFALVARSAGQGRRCRGRRGAAPDLTRRSSPTEARAEAGPARRLRLLCPRPRHGRAARRRHLAAGRERRMGEPGGMGLRPRLVAARRLQRGIARVPAGRPARPAARAPGRRAITGPRAPSRRPGVPMPSNRC